MDIKLKIFLFLLSVVLKKSAGALCNNWDTFGTNNVPGQNDAVGSNIGFGYQMRFSNWIVACCGVVDQWVANFNRANGVNAQTVYFQVWRPSKGSVYTLAGQNAYTVTADGSTNVPITQAERITVKPGDIMGWWTAGADIIEYDNGGGDNPDNYMHSMSALTSGQTLDWGTATLKNQRTYGIRMEVRANSRPSFTNLPDTVSLSSADPVGTSVFKVSVTDIDTYDVSTLSISMTANSKYTFDPSSLILTTAASLQTSGGSTQRLEFKVADQCDNTATATLIVTIINEVPVILNLPATSYVSEDAISENLLHTINATDPDGTFVTCALASSVPATYPFVVRQIPSSSAFGIYNKANPGFSYTTKNQYAIGIDCSDGIDKNTKIFTVYLIQNTPPVFINLQNATSISSTIRLGDNIFTVLVNDTDDLSFSMTCDTATCPFVIFDSGAIHVNSDLSTQTIVGYDLQITVSDGRYTVGPKTLTVTIADINDPVIINNLPTSVTVAENTAVGTSVFVVSITDKDVGQSHTYSMTSSPSSGLSYFSINSTTGEIKTSGTINYEAIASKTFVFALTASDPVTSSTKSLTVQITDVNEAPSFGQANYSLSAVEGSAGDTVGTPSFGLSDPDSGDTKTLTLDCGTSTGYFSMNSTSGKITYQSDYDVDTGLLPSTLTCTVTVSDSGGLKSTASLLIRIIDANDNTPVFSPKSYSFWISYYSSVGTVVGTVTARDGDAGMYGVLTLALDQSLLLVDCFGISNTGEITVKKTPKDSALGYGMSVTFKATASDIGGKSDTSSVIVVISDTTTTSTTTTTDRYRTFFEDTKNIAWVAGSLAVFVIALVALAYVIVTCRGQNGCAACKRQFYSRKIYFRHQDPYYDFVQARREPIPTVSGSLRHPPPPKDFQSWRRIKA